MDEKTQIVAYDAEGKEVAREPFGEDPVVLPAEAVRFVIEVPRAGVYVVPVGKTPVVKFGS